LYDQERRERFRQGKQRRDGHMQTFEHEMLREIYEQPAAIRRTLARYLSGEVDSGGRNSDCRLGVKPA
jgi:glucosamine 6-phosphate synthetase-like amidotransferase/phosphosugar isomerase protein